METFTAVSSEANFCGRSGSHVPVRNTDFFPLGVAFLHPPPVQMSETANEGDICQFVMRSLRSLEQAIYENVVEDRAASAAGGRLGHGETHADTYASGRAAGADTLGQSRRHFLACLIRDQGPAPYPSSILDIMRKMMRKHASDFYRIEHAAAG